MTIQIAFAITAVFLFTPSRLICAQAASTATPTNTANSESLQGTWEGTEVGREAEGKCTMTVAGDLIHFQGANKNEWYKATFTLPAGTNPKQLAATITECAQPDFVSKSSIAIFKIEDGKLTLTGHKPGAPDAPQSFAGDTTARTFIFKKAEPPLNAK